jgi:Mor family transcriptional regulator
MGIVSPPDTKRNEALLKDYESGIFTQAQLVAKYKVSAARIYAIINREKAKKLEQPARDN